MSLQAAQHIKLNARDSKGQSLQIHYTYDVPLEYRERLAPEILHELRQFNSPIRIFVNDIDDPNPKRLYEQLLAEKISVEIVHIPQELITEYRGKKTEYYDRTERHLKVKLNQSSSNTGSNLFLGSMVSASASGTGAFSWIYTASVEPSIALALVGFTAIVNFYHTAGIDYFDRFFAYRRLGDGAYKRVSYLTEVGRRTLLSLAYAEAFRFISGPIGQSSSAMTLTGQAEIFSHVGAVGLGGAILGSVRNRITGSDRVFSRWLNFDSFLLLMPLNIMDLSGIYFHMWDIGFYELKASTLAILTGYTGMALALQKSKSLVKALRNLSHWQERMFQQSLKRQVRLFNQSHKRGKCGLLF